MDEETQNRAKDILVKPVREWSKPDNVFIYQLIKKHGRDILKSLRNEALLDD